MTASFPHRYARVFREVNRDRPDMPLEEQFRLCHRRLHEQRIEALLTQLNAVASAQDPVRRPVL